MYPNFSIRGLLDLPPDHALPLSVDVASMGHLAVGMLLFVLPGSSVGYVSMFEQFSMTLPRRSIQGDVVPPRGPWRGRLGPK